MVPSGNHVSGGTPCMAEQMKIVPAYLLAVPLVVDSIVKLEFKMRYDEGGLKVTTTHLSRASIFPVYPALLVRGLIVITPYLQWIEYMDTNCMQIYHTMSGIKCRDI